MGTVVAVVVSVILLYLFVGSFIWPIIRVGWDTLTRQNKLAGPRSGDRWTDWGP